MASRQDRSKKPSGGSSSGRQVTLPEDFVLYLDENLHNCQPMLDALAQHGVRHERHGNHIFSLGPKTRLGCPPSANADGCFSRRTKESGSMNGKKSAILRYRVREFYFASGNYGGTEMAAMLVTALPEMARFCRRHDPPYIASISKSRKVSRRFPTNSRNISTAHGLVFRPSSPRIPAVTSKDARFPLWLPLVILPIPRSAGAVPYYS